MHMEYVASVEFQLIDMFPITGRRQKSADMFLTNRKNVDMFLGAILRTGRGALDMFPFTNEGYDSVVSFPRAMWRR